MQGKFKEMALYRGIANFYMHVNGEIVKIVDSEKCPIFGKRYKVEGHDEWFEENCFEWVK